MKEGEESTRNVVSLFAGVAVKDRRDGAAIGIDYVRRFGKSFGIGIGAERTFGDINANVFTLPFSYRTGRWKTWIGPGIEAAIRSRGKSPRCASGHPRR